MKIQFCGGAQTVTGSQHLIFVNGKKILMECGLFQGRRSETYEKNRNFMYDPKSLDAVLLSHAHIDHSGNIPNLVKAGYDGPIYATAATVDLCQFLFRDTAHLQEKDIEWVNKINRRKHHPPAEPLYSLAEAENSLSSFVGIQYNKPYKIFQGLTVTYYDAGHILGSAGLLLEINDNGRKWRLGFSGDIGRNDMPIIQDPNYLWDLDILIMESTYGNRSHGSIEDASEELAKVARQVASAGGKLIIPAFAVGKTQLLVYMLHKLFDQNRIPDMPIFVDSPLACNATDVFRMHPECFDSETQRIFLHENNDPFGFGRLKYIREVEDSKKLNDLKYPHIIISGSGMAEGGRILHHLRNNIENHKNIVLFVGYAAAETLARKLMDGEKMIRIFGEEHQVKCQIKTMDFFSAHADKDGLIDYVKGTSPEKLKYIFLVHGEPDQSLPLKEALKSRDYRSVEYPAPNDIYTI